MAKVTDFVTPTGQKGNLFSISSWSQMIIGVMVFIVAIAVGQNITNKVGAKLPMVDTQIDPFVKQPIVSSAPAREVY